MDETELIAALQSGDGSLAPLAVSLYGRALATYTAHVFPWLAETERELVCERAIEKAVLKISRFDASRGTFSSWIRGFVRHEVLDQVRKGVSTRSVSLEWIPADQTVALEPGEVEEKVADVRAAMSDLSESDQLILLLRTVEGYDYAAIARELEVDEAACRQRHRRALHRLRERLAKSPTGHRLLEQ